MYKTDVQLPKKEKKMYDYSNTIRNISQIFAHKLYAPLEGNTTYGFPRELEYEYFLENAYDMPNVSCNPEL